MFDWEKFQAGYQNASPEVKALIDSGKISLCVDKTVSDRYEPFKKDIRLYVSYRLLGIADAGALLKHLTGAGIPEDSAKEVLDLAEQCVKEIKESPTVSSSNTNVRTMQSDMQAAQTEAEETRVSTSQDELLKRPPTAPTPSYNEPAPSAPPDPPSAPRWETDSEAEKQ